MLAATHPSSQLMQLRQTHPLGVLDHHQAGVGHVHAHFDHGGGDQQLQVTALEALHRRILVRRAHPAMHQADADVGQGFGEHRGRFLGRLVAHRL